MVGVLLVSAGACTAPNPRSCKDGICNDQAYPFCDVDGRIGGTPLTCIAVDCTPMVFEQCVDTSHALVCNATGNDFDTTTCQNGCDEAMGGCVVVDPPMGCQASSECTNSDAPFCDPTNMTCRKCTQDNECASELCDVPTGHCIAEADVTYAAPNGVTGTCGTKQTPCTIAAAWSHLDDTHHVIKLAAGSYSAHDLKIPNTPATIYGYGATVTTPSGQHTFSLLGAASFRVDGASFVNGSTDADGHYFLGASGTSPTASVISFNDVEVHAGYSWFVSGVSIVAEHSRFSWSDPDYNGIQVTANSEITLNHVVLDGGGVALAATSRVHWSNSLILNTRRSALQIQAANGGVSDISFCTFVDSILDQNVTPAAPVVQVTSSVFMGAPLTNAVISGNAFAIHYSLLNPQPSAPAVGDHLKMNVDPLFVGQATGDFHLMPTSPAVDAADPAAQLADDFDGHMRPVGAARDMGAFEYKP